MSGRKSVEDGAFGHHGRKDGTVVISHYGHPVTILSGKEAKSSSAASNRSKAAKRGNEQWA